MRLRGCKQIVICYAEMEGRKVCGGDGGGWRTEEEEGGGEEPVERVKVRRCC